MNSFDLVKHVSEEHEAKKTPEEWNCNNYSFQGNCISELMKHLKLTGHQPSQGKLDGRKVIKDFKQCYTCGMEFDGYWNLMTHRKNNHPSNKRCRNFPSSCTFGKECWYLHVEPMDVDPVNENTGSSSNSTFNCNMCENVFDEKKHFHEAQKNSAYWQQ